MSHEGKSGKRKLTQTKTKSKVSPTPTVPMSEPVESEAAATLTGTNVNLEAYIWQENVDAGLVVMNVKWRGKTYCGAFIDIEKHNWQPPRLGEAAAPTEADHFTRGRNKRSLNSESEKGEEDTPSKRGRNKGKKKRGPTSQIKKVKKVGSEGAANESQVPAPSPSPSATSTDDKTQTDDKIDQEKTEEAEKVEVKAEEEDIAEVAVPVVPTSSLPTPTTPVTTPTTQPPTPLATQPPTPIISFREETDKPPEKEESTCQSVINSYSPHSKKVKNANIPKEMYGPESVIRTFNSPLNMPPIKPFINASPRSLGGYVVSNQEMMSQDISASKPQVIVKPERRDLQWNKHANLPVLKPQPHFTSHENSQTQNISVHALASINQQLFKEQQLQQQQQQQQQHLKKNEQFLSFKANEQIGHAFKNTSLFSKPNMPNISSANEYNAFANLQRHFHYQNAGEKPEMLGPEHRPSQEAAHSLLQLARPFSSKSNNPALDQLQYFSRMSNMPTISSTAGGPPPTFPPPRFSTDNKEELAKLMAFPTVGPKFPIPQVGKFR